MPVCAFGQGQGRESGFRRIRREPPASIPDVARSGLATYLARQARGGPRPCRIYFSFDAEAPSPPEPETNDHHPNLSPIVDPLFHQSKSLRRSLSVSRTAYENW